jgi:hypothetical protein
MNNDSLSNNQLFQYVKVSESKMSCCVVDTIEQRLYYSASLKKGGAKMSDELIAKLRKERDKLLDQRMRLDGEIAGIEKALKMSGEQIPRSRNRIGQLGVPAPKRKVRDAVLELLKDFPDGLTSSRVVDHLHERGNPQNPASVRSSLSAAAKSGELVNEEGLYRLINIEMQNGNAGPEWGKPVEWGSSPDQSESQEISNTQPEHSPWLNKKIPF